MGLSIKLNRSLHLERSLPSRTFPATLNRQQAAFYTRMTENMYRKMDQFPATPDGKDVLQTMESVIAADRCTFPDALRYDELCFIEEMTAHLDDLDEVELGAFWFTTALGDVSDDGKRACTFPLAYLGECQRADPEHIDVLETSFDVVTYHWSYEMKKECIRAVQHAWRFREMTLYALERVTM
jgi:hypothetical protein